MKLCCFELKLVLDLTSGCYLLGRNEDCDFAFPKDASDVSRTHAEISVEGDVIRVRDLDSRNGTVLDQRELVPKEWSTASIGSEIQVAKRYKVEIRDDFPIHLVEETVNEGSQPISISEVASSGDQRHAIEQLDALVRVTHALQGILETDDVLAETAEIMHDLLPEVERAVVGYVDEAGGIIPRWWHMQDAERISEIRISRKIVRTVVRSGSGLSLAGRQATAVAGRQQLWTKYPLRVVRAAPW